MSALYSILGLAFAITLIVAFHEFGHFSTAKMAGVGVNEFAIGFGPKIIGFKKGETEYALRAIPLGGYVDLVGMEEDEEATEVEKEKEFVGKSPIWRIIILFAGGFMNFVLAYLIFTLVYTFAGSPIQPLVVDSVIAKVIPNSPAANVGLKIGDKFVSVDGTKINSWEQFKGLIQERVNKTTEIEIERNSQIIKLAIKPTPREDNNKKGKIGVIASSPLIIGDVFPDSPVDDAGFKAGDIIEEINGRKVNYFHEIGTDIKNGFDNKTTVSVLVKRLTREITLKFKPIYKELGITPSYEPIVGRVNPGSPADRAGLKEDDKIISISGNKIKSWHEMVGYFSINGGKTLSIEVLDKNYKTRTVNICPKDFGDGKGRVGVYIKTEMEPPVGFRKGLILAWKHTEDITRKTIEGFYLLFSGSISMKSASGPVGIARIVGHQAEESIWALLRITALLSINIGLLNLFPIPALDGARIMFVFLEVIRGKKVSASLEEKIHTVGMVFLISLIIWVTWQDIAKLL